MLFYVCLSLLAIKVHHLSMRVRDPSCGFLNSLFTFTLRFCESQKVDACLLVMQTANLLLQCIIIIIIMVLRLYAYRMV